MTTRREEALALADSLLTDIELSAISPISTVRKASRLARLLDDTAALEWLSYEISGYQGTGKGLSPSEWNSAGRSGRRHFDNKSGERKELANTQSLSELQMIVETSTARLNSADKANLLEKNNLQTNIITSQGIIDKVTGAIHQYVSSVYQELRFGAAVESAFENVRHRVDVEIADLVPTAMPMLNTALENAQTDNPEQWKNAAKACRDLIKASADALRPTGPNKGKIKLGDANYINRLVDWIQSNADSSTKASLIKSDLEHLGKRLDAASGGGNKGAHAEISKEDASRFIVGTYILLGDILELAKTNDN